MANEASRRTSLRIITALLATGLALGPASQARAQQPLQERVRVADLDLGTAAGKRTFERRVEAAIRRVCPAPHSLAVSTPRSKRLARQCRQDARAQVQAQLQQHGIPGVLLATRD